MFRSFNFSHFLLFFNQFKVTASNIFYSIGSSLILILITYFYTDRTIGLFNLMVSSIGVLIILTKFGLDHSYYYLLSGEKRHQFLLSGIQFSLILSFILTPLYTFIFFQIVPDFTYQEKIILLPSMVLIAIFASLFTLGQTVFIIFKKYNIIPISFLIYLIIRYIFTFTLIHLGIYALTFAYLMANIFGTIPFFIFLIKELKYKISFNKTILLKLINFSKTSLLADIFWIVTPFTIQFFAVFFGSASINASVSITISMFFIFVLIPSTFMRTFFSSNSNEEERNSRVNRYILLINFLFILIVTIFVYFFSDYVVLVIGQSLRAGVSKYLKIIILAFPLIFVLDYFKMTFIYRDKLIRNVALNSVLFFSFVVLFLINFPAFGIDSIFPSYDLALLISVICIILFVVKDRLLNAPVQLRQ